MNLICQERVSRWASRKGLQATTEGTQRHPAAGRLSDLPVDNCTLRLLSSLLILKRYVPMNLTTKGKEDPRVTEV